MYNPTMMIPFILVTPLNGVITYLCMSSGVVARTFASPSWNMFCPIGALISTMDVKALLLVVGLIAPRVNCGDLVKITTDGADEEEVMLFLKDYF